MDISTYIKPKALLMSLMYKFRSSMVSVSRIENRSSTSKIDQSQVVGS